MEYTGEGIEALVAALDDLQNAGLIMADKKIKAVLKCLAYYDEFRTVLAYCSDGFDYAAEKRKALQKAGDYHVLRLPKNAKTLVPLVAGLLVEFDDGTEDFISFCATYYPAADRQGSMTACCADMLERFKLDIVSLVDDGSLSEEDRKDLLTMLEGYSAALDTRDTLMIKAVWLGVKRALASLKMCAKEIAAMDELLRLYLVSK